MQVKYWTNFNKRKNSTKQPSGGTEISVSLKNPCSVENPQIEVVGIPDSANYFYIADFGRYYFRSDAIKITKDITQFSLEVDTMATYKANVGATAALVAFTSSSSNIMLNDPRNTPSYETVETSGTLYDMSSMGFGRTGNYILGIASNGGINYYAMSAAQLQGLFTNLYDNSFAGQISNNFYDMKNMIVSCIWMPYTPTGLTDIEPIFIGDGAGEVGGGQRLTTRIRSYPIGSLAFSKPGASLGYADSYLDYSPYSEGAVYLPFVGNVPLDLDVYAEQSSLSIMTSIDQYTGDIVYRLIRASGDVISTYQGNFAVNVPIAGQSYNAIGAASTGISLLGGAASAIGGAVTGNAALAAGGLSGMAASGLSMISALQRHTQTNGKLSSAVSAGLPLSIIYHIIMRKPAETNLTNIKSVLGLPYYKRATISALSGYVQCIGASVDMPGTIAEKDTVNGYVNGGFYYE